MSCSNCFNGCAEPVSDKCVKYTGIDIPKLGISNGDTLLHVENKITEKLQEVMTGVGIIPIIDPADVCELVKGFLPCCPPQDLNDILTAVIKSICSLEERILVLQEQLDALNADYDIDCLTDITASSDTHEVVQAIITQLCKTINELAVLTLEVHEEYVRKDQIEGIVKTVISEIPATTLMSSRMVPWSILPYWGLLDVFDTTGAGKGDWARIFLCNGENGAPDLRGRAMIGFTTPGNVQMDFEVDPNSSFPQGVPLNPNYTPANPKLGSNRAGLTLLNMPSHDHGPITVTINDQEHSHSLKGSTNTSGGQGQNVVNNIAQTSADLITTKAFTGLKGGDGTTPGQNVFATMVSKGGNTPHVNYQPGHGMNFIIYIP